MSSARILGRGRWRKAIERATGEFSGAGTAASLMAPGTVFAQDRLSAAANPFDGRDIAGEKTDIRAILGYNNFYEFGMEKDDPATNSHTLVTEPWTVTVDGHCEAPGTYAVEDLIDFLFKANHFCKPGAYSVYEIVPGLAERYCYRIRVGKDQRLT